MDKRDQRDLKLGRALRAMGDWHPEARSIGVVTLTLRWTEDNLDGWWVIETGPHHRGGREPEYALLGMER